MLETFKQVISRSKYRKYLILLLEILAIGLWIFPGIIHRNFYSDWYNHKWLIAYYGEYFKSHFFFPVVLNVNSMDYTVSVVGSVYPEYYGDFLYRVLAIFYIALGSARRALLVSSGLMLLLQNEVWRKIFCKYLRGEHSLALALLWLFSIYPSTNFFIRGAITEFFAVCLLNILVGLWILALYSKNKISYWIIVGLGMASIFYIHPITAMYGTIFMVLLIAVTIRKLLLPEYRRYLLIAFGIAVFAAVVVLPFCYLVITKWPSTMFYESLVYIDGIDDFLARISLIPFDKRVYLTGMDTSTPNLSAAINMILFSINLYLTVENIRNKNIVRGQKSNTIAINIVILFLMCISTINSPGIIWGRFFRAMQFAYRLVSYIDLCIVCGVVYNLSIWQKTYDAKRNVFKIICGVSAILILQMLVVRYYQIDAIGDKLVDPDEAYKLENPMCMPYTFLLYGYVIYDEYKEVNYEEIKENGKVQFDVGQKLIGDAEPKEVDIYEQGWLRINMYAHPWNHIYLDGELYCGDIIYDSRLGGVSAPIYIYIDDIGSHILEYKFEPDKIYLYVRSIAKGSAGLLILLFIVSVGWLRYRDKRNIYVTK